MNMASKSKVAAVDPPAPRWPVRTPQVPPQMKKAGTRIGSSLRPKGKGK